MNIMLILLTRVVVFRHFIIEFLFALVFRCFIINVLCIACIYVFNFIFRSFASRIIGLSDYSDYLLYFHLFHFLSLLTANKRLYLQL